MLVMCVLFKLARKPVTSECQDVCGIQKTKSLNRLEFPVLSHSFNLNYQPGIAAKIENTELCTDKQISEIAPSIGHSVF